MNGAAFLDKRGKRHMARLLEQYERLHPGQQSETFKAIARDVIRELTSDARDVIEAMESGTELNGVAVELRDRIGVGRS